MKRKTCTLYLSCEEYGVILDALIRFKNKLPRQGRYTDIVDEVILALLDFPEVAKLFTEKVKQLFSFKEAQERAEKEAREKERQERIKARRNKRGMER